MTQALVCHYCRTWFEAKGKAPRCPSCGARYSPMAGTSHDPLSQTLQNRVLQSPDSRANLQVPAFLGRSSEDSQEAISFGDTVLRLIGELAVVGGMVTAVIGLVLADPLVMVAGAVLFGVPIALDGLLTRGSSRLLGTRWFYRYTGRE